MTVYAFPLGSDSLVNGPRRTLIDFGDDTVLFRRRRNCHRCRTRSARLRTFSDKNSTRKVGDMLGRLVKAAVIAAVLALVIDSLPDIKRYLELREM